jgi:hypothetical protein
MFPIRKPSTPRQGTLSTKKWCDIIIHIRRGKFPFAPSFRRKPVSSPAWTGAVESAPILSGLTALDPGSRRNHALNRGALRGTMRRSNLSRREGTEPSPGNRGLRRLTNIAARAPRSISNHSESLPPRWRVAPCLAETVGTVRRLFTVSSLVPRRFAPGYERWAIRRSRGSVRFAVPSFQAVKYPDTSATTLGLGHRSSCRKSPLISRRMPISDGDPRWHRRCNLCVTPVW